MCGGGAGCGREQWTHSLGDPAEREGVSQGQEEAPQLVGCCLLMGFQPPGLSLGLTFTTMHKGEGRGGLGCCDFCLPVSCPALSLAGHCPGQPPPSGGLAGSCP